MDEKFKNHSNMIQFATPENGVTAIIKTNMGDIHINLFKDIAKKTVENFITHAKNDYYNGIIFHRVMKDFMIQGGDPTGTGMGGESIFGKSFQDEFSDDLRHFCGALSMANSGPNTNGSQFFIVHKSDLHTKPSNLSEDILKAYLDLGGTPHLDDRHSVFGQVFKGMDVVDAIANVQIGPMDKPVEDVVINSIEIIE